MVFIYVELKKKHTFEKTVIQGVNIYIGWRRKLFYVFREIVLLICLHVKEVYLNNFVGDICANFNLSQNAF